jgi:antitoxin HigA-1
MTTPVTPIHPGEILALDFLEPLGVTQHRVAVSIGVPYMSTSMVAAGGGSDTDGIR